MQAATEINSELEDLLPQEMENSESFVPMPVKNDDSEVKYNPEPSIELEVKAQFTDGSFIKVLALLDSRTFEESSG